jgi:cell wall-associated NlpC family hydrolase
VVGRARACIGAPYQWGAVGPYAYDCSGLVSYAITGSHSRVFTTSSLMGYSAVSDPQPGDVCVRSGHCGIYIGGGQMIHAPHTGATVCVASIQSGMKIVRP